MKGSEHLTHTYTAHAPHKPHAPHTRPHRGRDTGYMRAAHDARAVVSRSALAARGHFAANSVRILLQESSVA